MKKTSFLALLGKNFPEKLSGLSVKGEGGYPPFPLRKKTFFFSDWFSVKRGGGYPLNGRIPLKRKWQVPLAHQVGKLKMIINISLWSVFFLLSIFFLMINIFFSINQYWGQFKVVTLAPLQPLYPPGRIIHIVRHHPKQRFSLFVF